MQKCLAIGAKWGHGRRGESSRERKVVALISIVNKILDIKPIVTKFHDFF